MGNLAADGISERPETRHALFLYGRIDGLVCLIRTSVFRKRRIRGHVLCAPVFFPSQNAGHIPYGSLRPHGDGGPDAGHAVHAIFPFHIVNRRFAHFRREIRIDIRHGDTVFVQEPLKQKTVPHRVNIRRTKQIIDQRTGPAAPPRANAVPDAGRIVLTAVLSGITDKIGYNQQVIGIAEVNDHLELILHPFPVRGRKPVWEPPGNPLFRSLAEQGRGVRHNHAVCVAIPWIHQIARKLHTA